MEQRSLRLGDIVDDYCPRERRLTNHAIVAIVGESIRQTRCTTCEAEHEYKDGRAPKRKLKNGETDLSGGTLVSPRPQGNGQAADGHDVTSEAASANAATNGSPTASQDAAASTDNEQEQVQGDEPLRDGWLAHRPLIRASLPKTDNDPPPVRAIPEFTMHQRQGRGFGGGGGRGGFRHGGYSGFGGGHGSNGQGGGQGQSAGNGAPRDPNSQPDGNRASRPGGKSRHRRRHRRPR